MPAAFDEDEVSAGLSSEMQAYGCGTGTEPTARYSDYGDADPGYGWMLFAGTMLGLVGVVNFIEGIAAIGNSHFFTHNAHYVFANLNTWG